MAGRQSGHPNSFCPWRDVMAPLLTCPQGHSVPPAPKNGSPAEANCPVCGAVLQARRGTRSGLMLVLLVGVVLLAGLGVAGFFLAQHWSNAFKTVTARAVLEGHTGAVRAVAFAPDGNLLASAGDDGKIRLWDRATGQESGYLDAHQGIVFALPFAPDGRTLASGGADGTVKLWDLDAR